MDPPDRRTFVQCTAIVLGAGLAGCTGGGDGDGGAAESGNGADGDAGGDDAGVDGAGSADGGGESAGDGGANGNGVENGGSGADTGSDDGNGTNGAGASLGTDYPAVEQWLTETSVGGADDSYDGSIADERGVDTVTVDVGAEGNGGGFAFGPSAVAISPGATVEWDWTGEGNPHNVAAHPGEQMGESDFEFRSGDAVSGSGVQYSQTFEETGVALYHCDPHLALGMKGAIVIAE